MSAQGKKIYTGTRLSTIKGTGIPVRIAFQVIERTADRDGKSCLFWKSNSKPNTSLPVPASTVMALYRNHGTGEQFHSEIKTELDLERLPSGKFTTNDLVLHFGLFAYNLLPIIGQESLKPMTPR